MHSHQLPASPLVYSTNRLWSPKGRRDKLLLFMRGPLHICSESVLNCLFKILIKGYSFELLVFRGPNNKPDKISGSRYCCYSNCESIQ